MAVNTLVTGMIVFKILKVLLEVKAATNLDQGTWGSLKSTGGGSTRLRYIIFVIIESGMALFVIQLVRIVVVNIEQLSNEQQQMAANFISPINSMFNVST